MCPRSLDSFNIVSFNMKWVRTSGTYSKGQRKLTIPVTPLHYFRTECLNQKFSLTKYVYKNAFFLYVYCIMHYIICLFSSFSNDKRYKKNLTVLVKRRNILIYEAGAGAT